MDAPIKFLPDNHYVKGAISGMCGILISHPVDTIKTHLQTHKTITIFQYKPSNLYRGIISPMLGVGLEKSIVFGTYNYCRNKNINIPASGAISGLFASLIVSPYERIKILRQNNIQFNWSECMKPSFIFK